jgi:hypothetical protein
MIIEYVGLPGAGKSYGSSEESKRSNLAVVYDISSRFDKYYWALFFALRHPKTAFGFVRYVITTNTSGAKILRHKIFFLLMRAMAREGKAESLKNAVVDEGLFWQLYALPDRLIGTEQLKACVGFLTPINDREVRIVHASREVRTERIHARARIPWRMNHPHTFEIMERNAPIIDAFLIEHFCAQSS